MQGQQDFFSEEAVKDRGCNIKYRTLLKERHGVKTDRETRQLSVADKALAMMLAHNARINVLMGKYRTECELKAKAKQEGKTYKDILAEQEASAKPWQKTAAQSKFKKSTRKKTTMKVDFELFVKDEKGEVITFEEGDESDGRPEKENVDGMPPAKDVVAMSPDESTAAQESPAPIEAEDTLALIQATISRPVRTKRGTKVPKKKAAADP